MIDTSTASALGISPARLPSHPAVFVNGIAYTVVGVYSSAQRVVSGGSAMLIPKNTALADYGNPPPGIGTEEEAQMIIATRAADNDGLAPGDTYDALHTACMNDAGYGQYASQALYPVRTNRGLGFAQAFGPWGYIGTALAAQEGFMAGDLGPGGGGPGPGQDGGPLGNLPAAAQTAAGKCFNILENFNNAQFAHSMSIIETLNNYISTDVIQDGEFKAAMRNWSACMAKNGFSSSDADTFSQQAQVMLGQRPLPGQTSTGPPGQPTAAQNKTQIAMAVADANCTLSSDLAGIYFAVQANYEQQFVGANQQALDAGVREYKAAFAKALKTMPALLRAASATPNLPGPRPGHRGGNGGTAKPSPSHHTFRTSS